MHRLYTHLDLNMSDKLILSDSSEIHHVKNVLRLKSGDLLQVFNGREQASGEIKGVTQTRVTIHLSDVLSSSSNNVSTILACAMPKKGKFETIIEKTTELGIDQIYPLQTTRTEVILIGDRRESKRKRFEKVAINASKQSQRITIPTIQPVTDFKTAVESILKFSTVLMPSLSGETRPVYKVLDELKDPAVISVLIGPEGDFTPEEYDFAHQAGCIPISLGSTILKVETAAIATVAVIEMYFNG